MAGIFVIPAGGMRDGHHVFEFEIDNTFFDSFEDSEIREGSLVSIVEAIKSSSHIDLDIRISGKVNVCCDRCLEMFDYPVDSKNRLLVKFGNETDDADPEIITIARDENILDISQYIYEFIHLALPIQRIHPENEEGESTCDPEMLQKLKEHIVSHDNSSDPGWDELKKLMDNN